MKSLRKRSIVRIVHSSITFQDFRLNYSFNTSEKQRFQPNCFKTFFFVKSKTMLAECDSQVMTLLSDPA